jgi:FKBP-type peptidyl-prolyl cis-trans isomerase SlyD
MYDAQGVLLDAPKDPLTYLHGGYGGLLEALEHEQAFGDYDPELLRVEPAERYGEGIVAGMQVEEEGNIYTVTDVAGGKVVLDGNHPLAGMALRFSLRIISVRQAGPEEISRGVSLP